MTAYTENREFMKSGIGEIDITGTADIAKGVPQPKFEKPYEDGLPKVELPKIDRVSSPKVAFFVCTVERCSRRQYTNEPLSLFELAFLLWCTQGVKKVIGGYRKYLLDGSGRNVLRPVASGGCVNAYETYLAINHVSGVTPGIWRYLPQTHEMVFLKSEPTLKDKLVDAFTNPSQNQHYTANAGVIFFWTCLPYRGEWRYKHTAHKLMLIDVGHISQNLYLATEAIECGCCAIGGYYQKKVDTLLNVDGSDEFTVLCASVGHIDRDKKDVYQNLPDMR
jgi:SagB-type dehydrogenase family enzyme